MREKKTRKKDNLREGKNRMQGGGKVREGKRRKAKKGSKEEKKKEGSAENYREKKRKRRDSVGVKEMLEYVKNERGRGSKTKEREEEK